jgi:hypothetical protein
MSDRPCSSSASTRPQCVVNAHVNHVPHRPPQMKTTELVAEVNACLGGLYRAHESLRAVASLTDKYRKNVHYNLQSAAVRKETGQAPAGEQ